MRTFSFLLLMTLGFSAASQVNLTEKILMSTELVTEFQIDSTRFTNYDTTRRLPIDFPADGNYEIVDFPDVEARLFDWEKSIETEIQKNFNASTKKLFKPYRRKEVVIIRFEFSISKEDELHDLVILDKDRSEVSAEIARILKTLKWRAGESRGQSVNSLCTLSVTFTPRFNKRNKQR